MGFSAGGQLAAMAGMRFDAGKADAADAVERLSSRPGFQALWAGWKHDNMKLPVVTAGGLGGALKTGRSLNYLYAGDDNRRVCSLYLSLMDRFGLKMDRFGDAELRLAEL
jgi:hypothetical protein